MKVLRTVAIKLNKAAEKAVKKGHSWVFEHSIEKKPEESLSAGSLCVIFDQRNNKPCAFGLWDPQEIIRIKIIYRGPHLRLNDDFWQSQLEKAHAKREILRVNGITGYRGIHGGSDDFPGLVLDVYAQTGVLKIYSEIWKPYLETLLSQIKKQYALETVVIRFSRKLAQKNTFPYVEGAVIGRELATEKVVFEEYGVRFLAYVQSGHKTGFFLDQRQNRFWLQQNATGKKILDVFSYVGGFGIHALKGGASSLTSIDISAHAMEVTSENLALNKLNNKKWTPIVADAFEALKALVQQKALFDVVVIDPPAFAKQASEVPNALKQYERLARLGKELVAHNGVLILGSCSSRITLTDFEEAHQKANISPATGWTHLQTTLHDVDHPIAFSESQYLMTIFYQKI